MSRLWSWNSQNSVLPFCYLYLSVNTYGRTFIRRCGAFLLGLQACQSNPENESDQVVLVSVSRNALREAVKVLSAKGLLKVKTRTGTQVQPREKWHLTDPDVLAWAMTGEVDREVFSWLTEFQKVIEPAAAEIAAVRASKGERARTLSDK